MNPYPRLSSFDVDPIVFSVMIDKVIHGDKKMLSDEVFYEDAYEDGWDDDDYDDMDGDWDSGMTSAGWGMDEDYGYFGEDF